MNDNESFRLKQDVVDNNKQESSKTDKSKEKDISDNAELINTENDLKSKEFTKINFPYTYDIIKAFSFVFLLYINAFAIYMYSLSLEGCANTRAICLKYYHIDILIEIFFQVLKAGIAFSIIIILAYWKLISKKNFLIVVSEFIALLIYDHGDDFRYHGYYNFYVLIVITFLSFLILLYITYIIKYIYTKNIQRLSYMLISLFVFIFIVFIRYIYLINCPSFHTGLNGVEIDDDPNKYSCFYDYPKKCYIDLLSPFMDYSKLAGNCKTIRSLENQKKYFTYFLINESDYVNTTRFGFPITTTNIYSLRTQHNVKHFNERVSSTIIDMDKFDKMESKSDKPLKPEVILDFSKDPNGEILININKNETLSQERKDLGMKYKSKFDNILFIFIDSLSKQHFKRKLKKTTKFIERFMKKNSKYEDYQAYQFMKYTTFDAFTQMSAQPMFYGEKMDPELSNGTLIIKYMKERGYITGQSIDLCSRELFVTMNNCLNKVEFADFDHENVAMFCDANYYNRQNPYPYLQGGFSIIRRCLYGRDAFEYVLEYGQKFWEAYPDNKKFLRLGFIDAHERSEEVIKYMDEPLAEFLENLFNKKLLENTAILFVSDHGNGMYGYYRSIKADDFLFERTLAFWFMILHGYKDQEGINNLKENEQTLLTPYDIHDTLSDIIFDEVNMDVHTRLDLGQSVFRKIDAKNRTCMKYTEWPLDEMCHCRLPDKNYSTPKGYQIFLGEDKDKKN